MDISRFSTCFSRWKRGGRSSFKVGLFRQTLLKKRVNVIINIKYFKRRHDMAITSKLNSNRDYFFAVTTFRLFIKLLFLCSCCQYSSQQRKENVHKFRKGFKGATEKKTPVSSNYENTSTICLVVVDEEM